MAPPTCSRRGLAFSDKLRVGGEAAAASAKAASTERSQRLIGELERPEWEALREEWRSIDRARESEDEPEMEEEWPVRSIKAARRTGYGGGKSGGAWEYLVEWEGDWPDDWRQHDEIFQGAEFATLRKAAKHPKAR